MQEKKSFAISLYMQKNPLCSDVVIGQGVRGRLWHSQIDITVSVSL